MCSCFYIVLIIFQAINKIINKVFNWLQKSFRLPWDLLVVSFSQKNKSKHTS